MSEPTTPRGHSAPSAAAQDEEIRERVRELTSQMLQQGRINSQSVQDVVRAVTVQDPALRDDEVRQAFAESLRALNAKLANSANTAHLAVEHIAARGKDFTDNDLKDALLNLRRLQTDYLAVVKRMAEAAGSGLRSDFVDLAARAQDVGADAMVGIATSMSNFANRVGENAATSLEAARGTSIRMALLASGVLQGVADALRGQAPANKSK